MFSRKTGFSNMKPFAFIIGITVFIFMALYGHISRADAEERKGLEGLEKIYVDLSGDGVEELVSCQGNKRLNTGNLNA